MWPSACTSATRRWKEFDPEVHGRDAHRVPTLRATRVGSGPCVTPSVRWTGERRGPCPTGAVPGDGDRRRGARGRRRRRRDGDGSAPWPPTRSRCVRRGGRGSGRRASSARINEAAGAPVVVSSDTFALIARAVDAWRDTGGRYDPTVLAALEAAGYDRDFDDVHTSARIRATRRRSGMCRIELDPLVSSVRLPPGALDLGGIGKGYAADGVSAELLDAACGVRGVGEPGRRPPPGRGARPHGWVVDVDDPSRPAHRGARVGEGAVATSTRCGGRGRGGLALHHLIDPRTGVRRSRGWRRSPWWPGRRGGPRCWPRRRSSPARRRRGLVERAGATGLFVTDGGEVIELAGLAPFRP